MARQIKRHPNLKEFSDDHHQGLVHALRLRKAFSGERGEFVWVVRDFLGFWKEETGPHFRKEEEVLLPVAAAYAEEVVDAEPVARMLTQHARIRGLAMNLQEELVRREVEGHTLRELG